MKRELRRTLIVLLFGLSLVNCGMTADGEKMLKELHRIAAETPVYSAFTQIDSNSISKSHMATLSFFYQSAASFNYEVKDFYIKELTPRGWRIVEEIAYSADTEGVQFRKGEYLITVSHTSPRRRDWDYSISYTWERP
jgi:hypothetical protein